MKTRKTTSNHKNEIVFLKGKKTVLRPLSEDDAPLLAKWVNDPDVRQYVENIHPLTESSEREWVANLKKKLDTDIVLGIVVKGKLIGVMGIHKINRKDGTATTGALIGEKEYWNKGYGTDAKMAVLNYAFNTLNLRKITSSVIAFNGRSLAYSLHCGYRIEGRLKRQRYVNGRYWDEILLGLFKSDWLTYWRKYQGE